MTVAPAPIRDVAAELEECVTVLEQEYRELRSRIDNRTPIGSGMHSDISILLIALGAVQLRARRVYQQAAGL